MRQEHLSLIQLTAENIQRLKAVSIRPDGTLTILGGQNENGKSSVIDALWMALGGSAAVPAKPIRTGQKRAKSSVELGSNGQVKYLVERTFAEDAETGEVRSTLKVKSAEGAVFSSPQKLLNDLCSLVAFDPLEFIRLKPADQAEQLRELLGAEFTHQLAELDDRHKETFDERTLRNRELKNARAQLQGLAEPDDGAELVEVDVSELTDELTAREEHNATIEHNQRSLSEVEREIGLGGQKLLEIDAEIARLNQRREQILDKMEQLSGEAELLRESLTSTQPIDTAEIRDQIKSAAAVNARVQRARAAQAQRQELVQKVRTLESDSEHMTAELAEIAQQKQAVLAGAPFPIPGLGFSESGGVTYQDLPFEQASGKGKIEVSTAIGMALNQKLRVMAIRDGSLLDSNGLRVIYDMAHANGYQILMERAADSPTGCEVWIEDGQVKQLPQRTLFGDEAATDESEAA